MDPVGHYLQTQIDAGRMPGAVWAVAGPRGSVSRGALGRPAVTPRSVPARCETLYDLASLTKPLVTAWALSSLEEQGRLSLETPMACGIGICFSCVAQVRQDGPEEWDYKRTCVEGPIFDSHKICW